MFIGELHHAVMSDDALFDKAQEIREMAKSKGMFEGVKIIPVSELVDEMLK